MVSLSIVNANAPPLVKNRFQALKKPLYHLFPLTRFKRSAVKQRLFTQKKEITPPARVGLKRVEPLGKIRLDPA